jgi:hypothetical protein
MLNRIQFNIDIIFKYSNMDTIFVECPDSNIDLNSADSVSNICLHLDHI